MANAAEIAGTADKLLARKLCATGDVPKPKLNFDPVVGLTGDASDDQSLCAGSAPIGKFGRRVDIHVLVQERHLINQLERAALLEVRGNGPRE